MENPLEIEKVERKKCREKHGILLAGQSGGWVVSLFLGID